jgi:hypothetical protein
MGGRRSEVGLRVAGMALVALSAMVALVACGDDDGGGLGAAGVSDEGEGGDCASGDLGAGAGDDGAADPDVPSDGPGVVLGACDLLEVAEVEEQLGMLGPVREGEVKPAGCLWPVGQDTRLTGLELQFLYHPADELADDFSSDSAEAVLDPVRGALAVPEVGDEAFLSYATLYVRSGEIGLSLSLESFAGAGDYAATLVPLAQQLVARL